MRIIRGDRRHREACLRIARELAGYFTTSAVDNLRADLQSHRLPVARDGTKTTGFVTIFIKNKRAAEISWLAVQAEHQGKGYGSALVNLIAAK